MVTQLHSHNLETILRPGRVPILTNALFVAEHSAIVLCIQTAASEANRAFINICNLNVSYQNTINKTVGQNFTEGCSV